MSRQRLAVTGIAALVTAIACAVLPAAHQPWQVGLCGIAATLGLAVFAIALGDD